MQLRGMLETSLYLAEKCFLETAGFRVKGEVNGCDVVAVRDERPAAARDRGDEARLQSRYEEI